MKETTDGCCACFVFCVWTEIPAREIQTEGRREAEDAAVHFPAAGAPGHRSSHPLRQPLAGQEAPTAGAAPQVELRSG